MNHDLLEALEQLKNMTAMLTGLRNDMIDNGWSPAAAEAVVFGIFQKMMMGDVQ